MLLNNINGNPLSDSKATFGEEGITDGDTRGCSKRISK